VGKAAVGRAVGVARTPDRAPTDMLEINPADPPVFVDASGRRRRKLRRLAYAIGAALLLALAVLWLSQLVGTVRPDPVSPCPAASAAGAARPVPSGNAGDAGDAGDAGKAGEACRR
jgi:hypothetical protein